MVRLGRGTGLGGISCSIDCRVLHQARLKRGHQRPSLSPNSAFWSEFAKWRIRKSHYDAREICTLAQIFFECGRRKFAGPARLCSAGGTAAGPRARCTPIRTTGGRRCLRLPTGARSSAALKSPYLRRSLVRRQPGC